MAEPILWVLGKNNADYLSFAPHGAGRNLSRTALKRRFPTNEDKLHCIEDNTKGIDVRWFSGTPDLSETPVAYKNAAQVKAQIEEFNLATIIAEIHPLGSLMAGQQKSWHELKAEQLTPKQKRQIQHRSERRSQRQYLRDHW